MDAYFEVSKARIRPVARVQMSVLSPEEIVSVSWRSSAVAVVVVGVCGCVVDDDACRPHWIDPIEPPPIPPFYTYSGKCR